MNKIFLAASIFAVLVTAAEAKCTKKSLNGNWELGTESTAIPGTAAGGVFTFTFSGSTLTMTLSSFSSKTCRGSGSGASGSTPFTFTLAAERIPGTAESPNQLLATLFGPTTAVVTLQRR